MWATNWLLLLCLRGGGNADLNAELVRLVRLAFADALHFRSVQAIDWHAIRLAESVNFVRNRNAANPISIILSDGNRLPVQQLLESVEREFVLAPRNGNAG